MEWPKHWMKKEEKKTPNQTQKLILNSRTQGRAEKMRLITEETGWLHRPNAV